MISFIVPIYNVEKYLPRTIESIVCQRGDWELILVDDGSPDGCPAICDKYAAEMPDKVRVIHKENGGVSTARNAGLDVTQGDWVWFIDGDDYIVSDAVEKLTSYIEEYAGDKNLDVVQFTYRRYYESENRLEPEHLPPHVLGGDELFLRYPCFNNVTMLFRRSIIEQNHLRFTPGLRLGEDMEFQVKYLMFCQQALQAPLSLSIYSVRSGSAMQNENTRRRMVDHLYQAQLNLCSFITEHNIKPAPWLAMRVRGFMTNMLYSASVSRYDAKELQIKVNTIIKNYNKNGLSFFKTIKMSLARNNVRAYIQLNRLYLKARGLS